MPDTTHPGQAPDAQYTRQGQAGVRRTVHEILILLRNSGKGWAGLLFPSVNQNGPSWGVPQKRFFHMISMQKQCKIIVFTWKSCEKTFLRHPRAGAEIRARA